jgi:hypothetical protein
VYETGWYRLQSFGNYLSEASESVIASTLNVVFAGTPIIFYPVQFRVELWIENDKVAGFFDYLLNSAFKSS